METEFALVTQHKWNGHKQHEIDMANASRPHWGPNATYIPPALVGSNANFSVCLGGNLQILAFLDTNMVVSPMQNSCVGGLPNTMAQCKCFCVAVEYRLKYYGHKIVYSPQISWLGRRLKVLEGCFLMLSSQSLKCNFFYLFSLEIFLYRYPSQF